RVSADSPFSPKTRLRSRSSQGKSDGCWKMNIPVRRGSRTGSPSTRTSPRSGRSKPASTPRSVDLPQPDGPITATNSPSATSKLRSSSTCTGPPRVSKVFEIDRTSILGLIAPAHLVQPLEPPHGAVEQEPDDADDEHAGHHEIVAVARVPRVDDQVAEAGAHRDHLGGHHHEPRDAEPDAHAGDDLRERGRQHHRAEEPEAGVLEVARG